MARVAQIYLISSQMLNAWDRIWLVSVAVKIGLRDTTLLPYDHTILETEERDANVTKFVVLINGMGGW